MEKRLALREELLSIEMQLLIALLSMENFEDESAIDKQWLSTVNWDTFIELARHHRVYPYLYFKLKSIDKDWIPFTVLQTLQHEYRMNTFQMLHLSGEMDRISRFLSDNGIRSLYLKGPVIAEDLYGNIALRTSCDLDFIISIKDLAEAEVLLIRLGYVKDDYIHTVLNDWKWRHHHITFTHSEKGIKIEIHWRLNPAPSKEVRFEDLWERRRKSALTPFPTYYLGREDLFLFLVSHGARHGWSRLRWLLDIKQLAKQPLDPMALTSLLRKHRYLHIGGQALVLASGLLRAPIASGMESITSSRRSQRLAQDAMFYLMRMVNLHTDPVPEEVERYHKRHLFSLLTTGQKLQFISSFLFPYPEDAETLPLPKALHLLYIPLRPFLWAWRKTVGEHK